MKNLKNKRVLITGAGHGLGFEQAKAFAGEGAEVIITDIDTQRVEDAVFELQAQALKVFGFVMDVTDPTDVERVRDDIHTEHGPIDVLVNNAGVAGPTGHDWELDPAQWWKVLEVNVLGQFYFASAAMPGMVARGHGRVVNVSSAAAGFPSAGYSAYCTSKAALTMWTEALAGSAAHYGVSVMGYHPGFVRTDMTEYSAARPDTEVSNPIVEFIRDGLATGAHDTMEDAVGRLLQVAAGVYDSLPGRQIGVNDPPEKLLPRAGEIEERGLYGVRINELAE